MLVAVIVISTDTLVFLMPSITCAAALDESWGAAAARIRSLRVRGVPGVASRFGEAGIALAAALSVGRQCEALLEIFTSLFFYAKATARAWDGRRSPRLTRFRALGIFLVSLTRYATLIRVSHNSFAVKIL